MSTPIDAVEIPIFPLGTVLFPGGVLPLKLFEARYLDMAARCMRSNSPFGVCLISEGGEVGEPAVPHGLGTIARIVDWDMSQPGLLFIKTVGGERFRIVERTLQRDRLQTARVVPLPEPAPQPVPEALKGALPLLEAIIADTPVDNVLALFDAVTEFERRG
jgi:Lon protease-like protein